MMQKNQMKLSTTVVATWLRSCSSCHIKMFDLQEEFIKYQHELGVNYISVVDIEDVPKADIGIIEGAVINKENEKILEKFREQSKIIIAVGTCACFGDSPGLRDFFLDERYRQKREEKDNVRGLQFKPEPLNQIVPVDYYIPGCPPLLKTIKETVFDLLKGNKPPQERTQNLCSECKRVKSKSFSKSMSFSVKDVNLSFDSFYTAIQRRPPNPEICFLEQGISCMGSMTCNGCGARCIRGNIPCWGCMGPILEFSENKVGCTYFSSREYSPTNSALSRV